MWDWHRSRHWKQSQKGWSPRHSSTTAQSHRRAYSTTPSPPQYTPTDLLGLHLLLISPHPWTCKTQTHANTTTTRPDNTERSQTNPSTYSPSSASQADTNHPAVTPRPLLLLTSQGSRAPPNAGTFCGSACSPSASLRCLSSSLFSSFFPHVTWSDSWEERPGTVRALGLLTRVVGESSKAQPCLPVYLHFNKQKCLFQYVDS